MIGSEKDRGSTADAAVGMVAAVVVTFAIGVFLIGPILLVLSWPLKLAWNWAVVPWLGLPSITYWRAFGVLVVWQILGFPFPRRKK